MDFNKYQSQIKTMVPLLRDPDFNTIFDNYFVKESNSDKFLIKMELKRLAQPCARILDLRDKVSEDTTQYTYAKLNHYLTASAIRVLEKAIKLYSGYTIGAFEMVLDHAQKDKLKNSKNNETTFSEVIQLNSHKVRANARMFFISAIKVTLPNGETYDASTSNISTSGVKIKLPHNISCDNNDIIKIEYTQLASEYTHKALDGQQIEYRLLSKDGDNDTFYFYLHLELGQHLFVDFLKSFIRGNQYKYKIDVQYYYNLALENALKNSALRATSTLPIYINANGAKPALFMLQNKANEQVVNDWRYNDANQLAYLFSGKRFAQILKHSEKQPTTTLYCFTYINNGVEYLLSATDNELQEDGIKQLFIQYGRSKLNFRTYHFSLEPYKYHENQRYEITSLKPAVFLEITHLATVTEITTNEILERVSTTDKKALNLLNKFVHKGKAAGVTTPVYNLFPEELRKEERYKHSSAIRLRVDGYSCFGKIIDFSFSGLKIQLNQIPTLTKRDVVRIDFIDLQKVSEKFRLSGIRYKAVASSPGKVYHFQVASSESFKSIRTFFTLLVRNNPQHFPIIPLKTPKQPVTDRLHEVAESSLNHALFFVNTTGKKPKLVYSSVPASSPSLKELFEINSEPNITHNHLPISNDNLLEKILLIPLGQTTPEGFETIERTIYVKKIVNKEGDITFKSFLDEDFASEADKREFILMHKERGQLRILHYRLLRISTPDLNIIKSEITMISRHAVHLSKQIQEALKGIGALIEIIDRTDHVLGDQGD